MADLCPEVTEYEEWFSINVIPKMSKLANHMQSCPACQEYLLNLKDQIGFEALKTSDETVLSNLDKIANLNPWSKHA